MALVAPPPIRTHSIPIHPAGTLVERGPAGREVEAAVELPAYEPIRAHSIAIFLRAALAGRGLAGRQVHDALDPLGQAELVRDVVLLGSLAGGEE